MKVAVIIRNDGREQSLEEWQKEWDLPRSMVSEHLYIKEIECDDSLILAEKIIEIFEDLRDKLGKPIRINRGYSTQAYTDILVKRNSLAVKVSPHVIGVALDLDTKSFAETERMLVKLRELRDTKYPYLRIGWEKYKDKRWTMVHIDVAPFFYGEGGIYQGKHCPPQWKIFGAEW